MAPSSPPARLTPAAPEDLADALAFALRFDGRKRKHDAGEVMARIVAKRVNAGFREPMRSLRLARNARPAQISI